MDSKAGPDGLDEGAEAVVVGFHRSFDFDEVFGTEVANVTTGAKAPEQALADANKAVEDIMRNAGYYN